ncbi:MAG: MerR family transcriptional regulator, partial [Elusimicrobia bacterium]|nr:MerR family transcriptional regulator [Elusimicrobiota bacterium]
MIHRKKIFIKIGDLSRVAGIPTSTIRYYNQIGVIKEAYRTPGGVRMFDRIDTLEKINMIRFINRGYTLKKIKEYLISGEGGELNEN